MAITARSILKTWFETGDTPLQSQFWNWLDSYWHKDDDSIPVSAINASELEALIQDEIANADIDPAEPISVAITGSGTATLPAGQLLDKIVAIGTAGVEVKVGTTASGDEIALGEISSEGWTILSAPWYADGSDLTIHLTATSAAFKLYFK